MWSFVPVDPEEVARAMIDAGRGGWLGRSGHFAERHALIVIIALGEVIVAIGLPVVVAFATPESGSQDAPPRSSSPVPSRACCGAGG